MTLVASVPTATINQSNESSRHDDPAFDDSKSQCSDDGDVTTIQPRTQPYNFADALVQCLGHPDSIVAPAIGSVSVENSSDVHFGDKNIYQGPVTIKQIVYANGQASFVPNSDKAKENLTFDGENGDCAAVDFKARERKGYFRDPEISLGQQEDDSRRSRFGKGFIWLQNVSKHRPMEIGIFMGTVILTIFVLILVLFLRHQPDGKSLHHVNNEPDVIKPIEYDPDITATSQIKNKLRMITRYEWLAQPPSNTTTPLVTPVPYVIIHHTATENCSSQSQCVFHVRQIQTFHIESRGWYDIGYNFLVGGDGAAYEGRGWIVEGAHTFGWNVKSIGIAFVGTFNNIPPLEIQILACKKLINQGIELGFIKKDYKLLGARQLYGTESPGSELFNEIKKWDHWVKEP